MKYTCPMHPEVVSDKPSRCPKCGMKLVKQSEVNNHQSATMEQEKNSYRPLIVVVLMILTVTLFLTVRNILIGHYVFAQTINYFMIGFFLVFSSFKLMDLKGFAEGYSTYDLLAKKWFGYGYIYPFIELFFGLAMIAWFDSWLLLWAEFIIMTFSGLGVAIKLLKHEKFQCACLGTFLKVPLTNVTLIEDFGMALLALILLFLG